LEDFSLSDHTRDVVRASLRLEMQPEKLTAADVAVLGRVRDGLGIRAAIAFEVHRALKHLACAKPSRRRIKR